MPLTRIFLTLLCATGLAHGHDIWIDAEPLRPAAGAEVVLYIRGGHYFPSSAIGLADRLIGSFTAATPMASRELTSAPGKNERIARLTIDESTPHRVTLTIKRPPLDEPEAWARLVLVPADGDDRPDAYAEGRGLEIVPRTPLSAARVKTPIAFELLRDGAPVTARIQILAAAGGTTWLDCRSDQPAGFIPRHAGRHLAMAQVGAQSVTLVFEVQP